MICYAKQIRTKKMWRKYYIIWKVNQYLFLALLRAICPSRHKYYCTPNTVHPIVLQENLMQVGSFFNYFAIVIMIWKAIFTF